MAASDGSDAASRTRVAEVSCRDLDVVLNAPFGIATGVQSMANNVLVRVQLEGGAVGWGESAPFASVNGETQAVARGAIRAVAEALIGRNAAAWRSAGEWLHQRIPESASARCAVETALIDALARHHGISLRVLWGGAETTLESDMTITTGDVAHATAAARAIAAAGYRIIKLKVGGVSVTDDVARIEAVRAAAPECALLLDANAAMDSVDAAVALVAAGMRDGGRVVLFEQPMHPSAVDAARELVQRAGVPIAADEAATSVADVVALARAGAADVVNLKIMKSGVVEALRMADTARAYGLRLMIGGMVETELAMSTSAALAAGLGGFQFVDLDTPAWLRDSPIRPGYEQRGAILDLGRDAPGHGASPREGWETR